MAMGLVATANDTRQRTLPEFEFGDVGYFMKLMHKIYDFFDEQTLIDVTFKVANPVNLVPAHRLVLSAASPYFVELFNSEKGLTPFIEFSDIESETFERLIIYCYTGKMLLTIENFDKMLKGAILLKLDEAVTKCVDFLIENINEYTLERAYCLEGEAECTLLSDKIAEYEKNNFMDVSQSTEFLAFKFAKLCTILESDDLKVNCEEDAFGAVKRWYEHDPSARMHQLPELISCLRLTQFDTSFVTSNILPLPGCKLIAFEMLLWINVPTVRSNISLMFPNPRTGQSQIDKAFLAVKTDYSGTIFQYNKTDDSWIKWFDIKMDVKFLRVVPMGDSLIFIGGRRDLQPINEVKSFNLKTKTFNQMPPMNESRWLHCVALLHDEIYAIAGIGASRKALGSVEKYTETNGWTSVGSMITPRYSAGAVTLNGKIYVVGGRNGKESLKSVECYDPKTNCWSQCPDLNEARSNPGVTEHNGQIFAAGGYNEADLNTVEHYDAQKCVWTKISSLNSARSVIGTISIDNQLWAVGGFLNRYVSVYNEESGKWIEKKPMPLPGRYSCFSVPKALLQSE